MTDQTLKPCPFGHDPRIEPIYRRDNTDKLFEDHPHDS